MILVASIVKIYSCLAEEKKENIYHLSAQG